MDRSIWFRRCLPLTIAAAPLGALTLPDPASAAACVGDAADLTAVFATAPDGLQGADYQRAIDLPDGRRLWTFQDAYVARPGRSDALVHNVGVVQDGGCFELLHGGSTGNPRPWLAADHTAPFGRWFWPLGATLPGDGTVRIFLAEFVEQGPRYLSNSVPVATWLATVDAATLSPIDLQPAPNPGPELYGWSVASDARFTYLYGHCYRQFGFGMLGHDGCTAAVTLARTSHDLTRPLQYWDGVRWLDDPTAAVNVAPTTAPDGTVRGINPTQVARVGSRWVAVTKEGDWWGSRIYVDVALHPGGPWRTAEVLDATAPVEWENTYFASIVATGDSTPGAPAAFTVGLSHNRWDGGRSASYRPSFQTLPVPQWTAEVSSPEPRVALRSAG